MSEYKTPVRAFSIQYLCDDCAHPLRGTGVVFTCLPPLYEHKCPDCSRVYKLNEHYPTIRYEP